MKKYIAVSTALLLVACGQKQALVDATVAGDEHAVTPEFEIQVDRFADVEVLPEPVPYKGAQGFWEWSL